MIYLFWTILNVTLALYFLYLFIGFIVKGRIIFQSKFKFISIAVFSIGIIQMLWGSSPEEKVRNNFFINNQIQNVKYEAKMLKIDENAMFYTNLFLKYYMQDNQPILEKPSSSLIGMVGGFEWELNSAQLIKNNKTNSLLYTANGTLHWKLFNSTIFKQHKFFQGTIED